MQFPRLIAVRGWFAHMSPNSALLACAMAAASCTSPISSTDDGSTTKPPTSDGRVGDGTTPTKDGPATDAPAIGGAPGSDAPMVGSDATVVVGDGPPPAGDVRDQSDTQTNLPPYGSVPMVIPALAWSRDISAGGYKDGLPIGGFGAGSVTWRFDGAFYKDRLNIGATGGTVDPSAGFYLYEKCGTGAATVKKLDATAITGTGQAKYYAFFPKAWFDYAGVTGLTSKVKVAQWSPVIPNDYQRSSYPLGVYDWEITNPSTGACDVAVMFTWKNDSAGASAEAITTPKVAGIKLKRAGTGAPSTMGDVEFSLATAVSAGVTASYQSAATVADLATKFGPDGTLANTVGAQGLGGLAVKVSVPAGGRIQFPMVLAWDIPIVQIGSTKWYREYTRHFGRTGLRSADIAADALTNYGAWGNTIDAWHKEISSNSKYPAWLPPAMLNEMYYYIIGGTVWEAGAAGGQADNPDEDMFSSVECFEYPGYGTSDVRFYGSWPLALYWPSIDKQEVKQFCDSVTTTRTDRPKALGTTAHDFGGDHKDVFVRWNTYQYRDSTQWKDLNSKLVLMVHRDWALTGKTDKEFISYCWPAIKMAMDKTKGQDSDNDGLPNSTGIDQTYDNMELKGNTAYCGTLFVAAAEAAQEIATAMGETAKATTYQGWVDLGKASLEKKLWNGSYYKIDDASDRIMSDQLAGEWYAKACGLPGVVPADHATSAFKAIYANNYKKFGDGNLGIVNVVSATGAADGSSEQTKECWVGTAWGAIAGMVQSGLFKEADEAGKSLFGTIWDRNQLWFRTPEAFGADAHRRAWYYMRTNSVWAVKRAYDITPKP